MNCPYCNEELSYEDYYGTILPFQDGNIIGYIFKCENEKCKHYQDYFHTVNNDDSLYDGYPC